MLNRLILKVTKFQLPPPKRLGTVVKNIWGAIMPPPPMSNRVKQIFVDFNRFNKGEINELRIEWNLKKHRIKRETFTEATVINPASIHTSKTKHQNKVQ